MDMTSEAFIAALRRFIARRGCPETLSTDNDSNFIGTQRELGEFYKLLSSPAVQNMMDLFCTAYHIQWPARSPQFGGLWEAGVRSMKTILHKTVGTHVLSVEESYSNLADVEAVLNSCPLVPMDGAQTDGVQVLTPGHFLVGRPLTALPSPNLSNYKLSTLRRCLCQRHTEKWIQDYIQQLH